MTEPWRTEAVIGVLGWKANEVLNKVPIHRNTPVTRMGLPNAEGLPQIFFTPQDWEDPFVFVHEVAHAYHGFFWPKITHDSLDTWKAEGIAFWAECRLAAMPFENNPEFRLKLIAGWPLRLRSRRQSAKVSDDFWAATETALLMNAASTLTPHQTIEQVVTSGEETPEEDQIRDAGEPDKGSDGNSGGE